MILFGAKNGSVIEAQRRYVISRRLIESCTASNLRHWCSKTLTPILIKIGNHCQTMFFGINAIVNTWQNDRNHREGLQQAGNSRDKEINTTAECITDKTGCFLLLDIENFKTRPAKTVDITT